ncbi:acyl-CoA dehydrogenase family protein [Pseudofrankia inefficax]|uniref:Acyl-CoA dehydrogenase domain-containing protein n=1 Tax=Pseudofrankia inefficax (strain DSM 45817 / CECT 9037 / DDB 130130 / EuI1c) TaxID=298654 RepID=E3IVF1_PSEI1|nr:acyl-CoA dehydrogenase family protein [Pseudofrankia inefficax]ADP81315.1 acyl-CoA dehydrogenase domain-containing protein [Pseudofrankia inefficax]
MNLEPTDEQRALRATVRRFLAERATIAEHVRPMLADPTGTTDLVWRGLADLGATGLLAATEHGGAGMSLVEAGIVLEELGAALYPGPWQSSAVAAARALARTGASGDEATKLLAGIADGATIATVAPLEATDGRPTAELRRDGYVLRGGMPSVPDAAAADVLLVLATDRGDEVGLFLVDATGVGLTVTPRPTIDQTRKQCQVTLKDTPARRLSTVSPEALTALVDDVLIAAAADAVGAAQAVLDLAIQHATTRQQFGQPIGSFQAVQRLCVDMYESVELARSGVLHALWAADAGSAEERHLSALRVKAFSGRLAAVGDAAIQVFGGLGYTWEHDAHLYLKRLLSWSALLGEPDRYLKEVGSALTRSLTVTRSPL